MPCNITLTREAFRTERAARREALTAACDALGLAVDAEDRARMGAKAASSNAAFRRALAERLTEPHQDAARSIAQREAAAAEYDSELADAVHAAEVHALERASREYSAAYSRLNELNSAVIIG